MGKVRSKFFLRSAKSIPSHKTHVGIQGDVPAGHLTYFLHNGPDNCESSFVEVFEAPDADFQACLGSEKGFRAKPKLRPRFLPSWLPLGPRGGGGEDWRCA